jgi:hypothetical protein
MYNTKLLKLGDKVEINPIYRTDFAGGFVKGKTGEIAEIKTYMQLKYLVIYDEPYSYKGYTFKSEYFYPEELEEV